MKKKSSKDPNCLSVQEHVAELRKRVGVCVVCLLIGFVVCYANWSRILVWMLSIGERVGFNFVYLAPQDVLLQQIKVSAVFAFVICLPVVVTEAYLFVAPAFEGKGLCWLVAGGVVCFCAGVVFCAGVLLPFVFQFLYSTGKASGITAQISINSYLDLVVAISMAIGCVFEIPVVSVGLCRAGVLSAEGMKRIRPWVIVGIFVVAAVITPPDVVSQIVVALPMIALYQVSIWLCSLGRRRI